MRRASETEGEAAGESPRRAEESLRECLGLGEEEGGTVPERTGGTMPGRCASEMGQEKLKGGPLERVRDW